jgi:hypothetical protein
MVFVGGMLSAVRGTVSVESSTACAVGLVPFVKTPSTARPLKATTTPIQPSPITAAPMISHFLLPLLLFMIYSKPDIPIISV